MSEHTKWLRAARRVLSLFNTDFRNHRMLSDPWQRAVHCMVQSWRIRSSQPQRSKRRVERGGSQTWEEAATRMKASLDRRAREQRLKGTWKFWAEHRPPVASRYIRKSKRASS